jgi:16S rRNA (uracil1498-N3)-methyltransferase
VVVGGDRAMSMLPTFVVGEGFAAGQVVTLGEEDAHHMRVRRLEAGIPVGLLDGQGTRGEGVLLRIAKRNATVEVTRAELLEPPPAAHLLLPVADRDRMLWLAEKATELAATSWRPVLWKRSKSVNPRGEGPQFHQKVAARMASALAQSGGAFLPVAYPDAAPDRAIAAAPEGARFVCDGSGVPMMQALDAALRGPTPLPAITVAIGPEGGFEEAELAELESAGFVRVRLGGSVLRFETAAASALAVARAALDAASPAAE